MYFFENGFPNPKGKPKENGHDGQWKIKGQNRKRRAAGAPKETKDGKEDKLARRRRAQAKLNGASANGAPQASPGLKTVLNLFVVFRFVLFFVLFLFVFRIVLFSVLFSFCLIVDATNVLFLGGPRNKTFVAFLFTDFLHFTFFFGSRIFLLKKGAFPQN